MASEATKQPKKRNTDWDAVERDYRTGKFTLQELGAKYGVSHQAVAKKQKAGDWKKDLQEEIKQATKARVTKELVEREVARSGNLVADTVEVAAAVNAQILFKQQTRAAELQNIIDVAKSKLLEHVETLDGIRDVATLTTAVNNLANATKTLNEQERKAHNMDAEDGESQETGIEELWRRVRSGS